MNQIKKIDILRGLALLAVFLFHSQESLFPNFEVLDYTKNHIFNVTGFRSIILNFWPIGFAWTAVYLFMIISGFLIHLGYLSSKKKFNVLTFYGRRFWRIFPAYLFALLFFYIVQNQNGSFFTTEGIRDLLSHIFMVHNLSGKYMYSINPVFWSLAVEVQIYFIYPLILILRRKTGMLNTLMITLLLSVLLHLIGIYFNLEPKAVYRKSALMYLFVWCAGAFFAEKFYYKEKVFPKGIGAIIIGGIVGTVVCKIFSFTHYFMPYFGTLALLAFFEWFLTTDRFAGKSRIATAISTIGICSYSIYLIHLPFLNNMLSFFSPHSFRWLSVIPVFIIVSAIAYPMYLYIEMPSIKIGKNLMERKKILPLQRIKTLLFATKNKGD